MQEKTCCVTGHREIPAGKADFVKRELRREIAAAVADGYTHFLSGFAEGADLWFAEAVLELGRENPAISLGAAIPYRRRLERLRANAWTRGLLAGCAEVKLYSGEYCKDCFIKRNRAMVSSSGRVIAVYDGRAGGGTVFTMREASLRRREMRVIRI